MIPHVFLGELNMKRTLVGRMSVKTIVAAAACFGAASVHAASTAVSDFTTDADGWVLAGDATTAVPTFVAAGGNPGGFIRGFDQTVGGTWYWQAPAKFLGDRAASFDQMLTFDLRMRGSGPIFAGPDVVLAGAGTTLNVDLTPTPQDVAWTRYSVALSPAGGWRVGTLAGPAATNAQLQQVLANLGSLRIRGEFITGSDNGDLDNVMMPIPEPGTYALFGAGLGCVAWVVRRRRSRR
jgi:hypothetical protein